MKSKVMNEWIGRVIAWASSREFSGRPTLGVLLEYGSCWIILRHEDGVERFHRTSTGDEIRLRFADELTTEEEMERLIDGPVNQEAERRLRICLGERYGNYHDRRIEGIVRNWKADVETEK